MQTILVVYATREGHTRRIAEHVAEGLRKHSIAVEILDARESEEPLDLSKFSATILAASVHLGRHEKEMVRFVQRNRAQLEALPSAFLSVSLSEAGVESEDTTAEHRAQAARDVARIMDAFFQRTGWHPDRSHAVAGALLYTEYNLLVRWVMRGIAKHEGGSTDTSRDHVYTDWDALDRFVDAFVGGTVSLAVPVQAEVVVSAQDRPG